MSKYTILKQKYITNETMYVELAVLDYETLRNFKLNNQEIALGSTAYTTDGEAYIFNGTDWR